MTTVVFPDLPIPGELVADHQQWRYPSQCIAGYGIARLRVWDSQQAMTSATIPQWLAIVTETGQGASITNSAESIQQELTTLYGVGVILLEHWPADQDGTEEHLDQVAVAGPWDSWPQPVRWRRVWPTPPSNPDHHGLQAWMDVYGHDLLATR